MRWRLKVTKIEIKVKSRIEIQVKSRIEIQFQGRIEIEINVDSLFGFQSLEAIDRAKTIIAVEKKCSNDGPR